MGLASLGGRLLDQFKSMRTGITSRLRRGPRLVDVQMTLAVTPEDVWRLVSDVTQIERWWPRALSGEVTVGEGAGREQTVTFDWGRRKGTVRQRVVVWDPPYRYGWHVVGEAAGDRPLPPSVDTQITIDIAREGPVSRVAVQGSYEPVSPRGAFAIRQIGRLAQGTFKEALHRAEAALLGR